jgi:hypothetical protein
MVLKRGSGAEFGLRKRNDSADRTVLKCGIMNNFFYQIGFSKKKFRVLLLRNEFAELADGV